MKKQLTFFPGFPSTSPTTFSPLPTILSTTFSVFVRGFLTLVVLVTRPEAVPAVLRGLLVLALGVFFVGAMVDSMAWMMRGCVLSQNLRKGLVEEGEGRGRGTHLARASAGACRCWHFGYVLFATCTEVLVSMGCYCEVVCQLQFSARVIFMRMHSMSSVLNRASHRIARTLRIHSPFSRVPPTRARNNTRTRRNGHEEN